MIVVYTQEFVLKADRRAIPSFPPLKTLSSRFFALYGLISLSTRTPLLEWWYQVSTCVPMSASSTLAVPYGTYAVSILTLLQPTALPPLLNPLQQVFRTLGDVCIK